MSPHEFHRLAGVAWLSQALIVASGAAVRLTQAGLGCEDWPTCNEDRVVPELELHGWIEFGNRLISLAVSLTAVAVVVAARRRRPARSDLTTLSWWLAAGTMAQIVLGGITVLADLNPVAVSGHFLVSMGLLFVAQRLWRRSDPAGRPPRTERSSESTRTLLRAQLPLAGLVLFTGTLVTGTGPNSGDSRADRLALDLEQVARVHSVTVWLLGACILGLALRLRPGGPDARTGSDLSGRTGWLLAAIVAQGAIGYIQFALGVPPGLVQAHVIGAVLVWSGSVALHLQTFDGPVEPSISGSEHHHDPVVAVSAHLD